MRCWSATSLRNALISASSSVIGPAVNPRLWIWFAVRTARLLLRVRARPDAALPARAALLAGLAVLILMVTDNPMDYSFVLLPLGVLIGLALGARSPSAARGPITEPEARPVAPTSTPPG